MTYIDLKNETQRHGVGRLVLDCMLLGRGLLGICWSGIAGGDTVARSNSVMNPPSYDCSCRGRLFLDL